MSRRRNTLPITLLVCDHDEEDRRQFRRVLDQAQIANDVRFVLDGAELLDYLYQRGPYGGETGSAPRPGLILMDLQTPGSDRRAVLELINGDPMLSGIPVVGLIGAAEPPPGDQPGVDSCIPRPVTLDGLLRVMARMERYRLEIVELPPVPR